MSTKYSVPRNAWILGFILSIVVAGSTVVVFIQVGPRPMVVWLFPPLLCAIAAFGFTLICSKGSWFWSGVLMSCGFIAFFVSVFVSYLSIGIMDYTSLLHGTWVLLASLAASYFASTMVR